MIPGGAGSGNASDDRTAAANREFFNKFAKPSMQSLGFNSLIDIVADTYNFNANALQDMSAGGTFIAQRVRAAIGGTTRVVYSAGGGENTAAEAVAWLRKQGYSDLQIRNHFAVVQHSVFNWQNATEAVARGIIGSFTIKIEDQNTFTGLGKPPLTVSAARTSSTFANAWLVAVGSAPSGIGNFVSRLDASDAGSHHFASNAGRLDIHWNQRNATIGQPGSPSIPYPEYTPAVMNAQMN
jgi:hypothetical protein